MTTKPVNPPEPQHRAVELGTSPFGPTLPGVIAAIVFGIACLVWLAAGDRLPGGRWIVVHVFTLGVMTTLIWTFSQHFAGRFTANPDSATKPTAALGGTLVLVTSIVTMLAGRALDAHLPLALGSVGIMLVVGSNLVVLRRQRRHASASRFVWIVRQYEHAHLAFIAAAGIGGALGAGWLPGSMFAAARNAHMHLNVLGWAGLTVLATLVAFGPALLRVRIAPKADVRAATGLQAATLGLWITATGFFVMDLSGDAGPVRLLTVGGLLAYGYGLAVVAWPLLRTIRATARSPLRWAVAASLVWFAIAVVLDIVIVAFGAPGWPREVTAMLLLGVLTQLVLAVLSYVGPMLRGRNSATRDRLIARVERLALARAAAFNLGIILLVGAQATARFADLATVSVERAGWITVATAAASQLLPLLWPTGTSDPDRLYSATAARYRTSPGERG
jgi:nitrite reductase (NO-forming)